MAEYMFTLCNCSKKTEISWQVSLTVWWSVKYRESERRLGETSWGENWWVITSWGGRLMGDHKLRGRLMGDHKLREKTDGWSQVEGEDWWVITSWGEDWWVITSWGEGWWVITIDLLSIPGDTSWATLNFIYSQSETNEFFSDLKKHYVHRNCHT